MALDSVVTGGIDVRTEAASLESISPLPPASSGAPIAGVWIATAAAGSTDNTVACSTELDGLASSLESPADSIALRRACGHRRFPYGTAAAATVVASLAGRAINSTVR